MCVCVCVRYDSVHLSMKLRQSGVRVYIQREREMKMSGAVVRKESRSRCRGCRVRAQRNEKKTRVNEQAAWIVTERLRNLIGRVMGSSSAHEIHELEKKKMTREEVVLAIREDVQELTYFVTGDFSAPNIYSDDCEFIDDFASFRGFTRFRDNLRTLALLTEKYDVKILSLEASPDETRVLTRAFVRLNLSLPWKPVLAWVWTVEHTIARVDDDDTNYTIVKHAESWEIDTSKGVELLFKPGPEAQWPFRIKNQESV